MISSTNISWVFFIISLLIRACFELPTFANRASLQRFSISSSIICKAYWFTALRDDCRCFWSDAFPLLPPQQPCSALLSLKVKGKLKLISASPPPLPHSFYCGCTIGVRDMLVKGGELSWLLLEAWWWWCAGIILVRWILSLTGSKWLLASSLSWLTSILAVKLVMLMSVTSLSII